MYGAPAAEGVLTVSKGRDLTNTTSESFCEGHYLIFTGKVGLDIMLGDNPYYLRVQF